MNQKFYHYYVVETKNRIQLIPPQRIEQWKVYTEMKKKDYVMIKVQFKNHDETYILWNQCDTKYN